LPTYQYACTECGHGFEAVQSFTDDALTECPQCTGRLRKVFNSVGIVFKGSGFYRTDSREKEGAVAGKGGTDGKDGAKDSAGAASDGKKADGKKADGQASGSGGSSGSGSAGSPRATPSSPGASSPSRSSTAASAA